MADPQISELVELAQTLGTHPARLALWNEGSAAMKISDDRFAVTPRNIVLARLGESDVCELDLPKMLALAASEAAPADALEEAILQPGTAAPTVDALLYAYLLGFEGVRFAAHVHPVEVNQITASPRARQFADRRTLPHEVIACGSAALLVPYVDPGLALAREVQRKMILWKDRYKITPKLVLVQNHGMFVLAGTQEEIFMTTEMTIKAAQTFAGAAVLGGPIFLTPSNVTQIEATREF